MSDATTAVDPPDAPHAPTWLHLGRTGWIAYAVIVILNVLGGLPAFDSAQNAAAYVAFCVVAGYVFVLFWKVVLQYLCLLE